MATLTVNIDKPPIPTGYTLWVDAVNGDDATGTTGRQDLPYLTLTAARDAANSGDLVYVRPGTYSITESLAKNGVNWYLEQGCSISKNNGGGLGIFDDDGVAMSFSVYGYGYMECIDDGTDFTRTYGVIATRNAGTKINVAAKALHVEAPQEDPGLTSCCWGFNGDMFVTCDEMTGDYANNIYWENGGMFITCPSLVTNGIASVATIVNDAPTGKLWVNSQQIASTNSGGGGVLSCAGTRDDFQVWVTCMEIEGVESSVLVSGGKVYVSAQKITGPIVLSDGQSWIKTDKHAGNGRFIECQSGTHFFTSPDIEDNGTATDWIFVSGGDLTVLQSAAVGDAFTTALSGGVLRLKECTIDTSSGVSGVPITKSGGVVELDGCNLIAPSGVDSVSAPTAQTIEVRASTANNAVNSNVSVIGSLQIGASAATTGQVPIATARGTWAWGAIPDASETAKGIIEIATAAEVAALNDTTRAVTSANLKSGALIDVTPSYINYTGGSIATTSTSFADLHASAAFNSLAPGFYIGEFFIGYNAAATTTGARFALNGTVTQDYLTYLIGYSTQSGDRSSAQTQTFDSGAPAPSSISTTGNNAILQFTVNVTVTGDLVLRFASEVGGSAITVTNVIGFIRRVS